MSNIGKSLRGRRNHNEVIIDMSYGEITCMSFQLQRNMAISKFSRVI